MNDYKNKIYQKANFINSILYTAVLLDDASKNKLKQLFPGKHKRLFGEHVTLKFKRGYLPDDLGNDVTMTAFGYANDNKGEAVAVKLHGAESDNKIPHVTISTSEDTKPVYSNELLAQGYEALPNTLQLSGKVAVFANGKFVTDKNVLFPPSQSEPNKI